MKILIDSNVLIAALLESHTHHQPSKELIERAFRNEYEVCMSLHCLAETYSQLTRLPTMQVSPQVAISTMTYATDKLETVPLDADDYAKALTRAAHLGVFGGGVYDLLHFEAALKSGADMIATNNLKHFERACSDGSCKARTPKDLLQGFSD